MKHQRSRRHSVSEAASEVPNAMVELVTRMRSPTSTVVIVTSGLGVRGGGIGVVSAMMRDALKKKAAVYLWRHPHRWSRRFRLPLLAIQSLSALWLRNALVLYEHVDLARIHARLPWLARHPYAVFLHGTEVWRALGDDRREALERASLLMANSEFTVSKARALNSWLPEVHVVWLGVERSRHSERVLAAGRCRCLIVGRMNSSERYKGHDQVLEAWPAVVAAHPDAELVIVGDGDDRARLEEKASGLCLKRVRFRGQLTEREKQRELGTTDLFLFPSSREGFGLAAMEALAAGVPVLALVDTVLEELFPGDCGVLFAPSQVASAVEAAVNSAFNHPDQTHDRGGRGRARVEAQYLRAHFEERLYKAMRLPLVNTATAHEE